MLDSTWPMNIDKCVTENFKHVWNKLDQDTLYNMMLTSIIILHRLYQLLKVYYKQDSVGNSFHPTTGASATTLIFQLSPPWKKNKKKHDTTKLNFTDTLHSLPKTFMNSTLLSTHFFILAEFEQDSTLLMFRNTQWHLSCNR